MSDGSRIGGDARTPINVIDVSPHDLHIHTIPTMTEALRLSQRQYWSQPKDSDRTVNRMIGTKPVDGDKPRLDKAMDRSEQLVSDAIEVDPRLARRAQWKRADEGEHCDSGLLAMGDDQPFYKYTRRVVTDAAMCGEPLRIVISTDDNKVPKDTAAAFIATARLVQQFIPLEIWWQGAWLSQDKRKGFVFHVPLVQGDMDFSRLEFCIADPVRDCFSFNVMASHAVLDIKEGWNNCGFRADQHYLLDSNKVRRNKGVMFVSHHGISPDAQSIAWTAARWIGWEPAYHVEYDLEATQKSAAQSLPEPPQKYEPMSADDRRRSDETQKYFREQEALEAKGRLAA